MIRSHLRRWLIVSLLVCALALFGYWWVVYNRPAAGQPVISEEDRTNVEAVRPRNFTINATHGTGAQLEWQTETPSEGYVLIGETAQALVTKFSDTEAVVTSSHKIRLFDLQPGKKYYYIIVSNGLKFGRRGEPLELLTTP